MTLLYRAIWQDEREHLVDEAEKAFRQWLTHKKVKIELPKEGFADATSPHGPGEVVVRRAFAGATDAAQFELSEERPQFSERWTVRLTAIDGGKNERWLWVDLERVAGPGSVRPPLAAPKLVRDLIDSGVDPKVDQVRLEADWYGVPPKGLAGVIRNAQRTLPLVVLSEGPGGFTPTTARAEKVAHALCGAAQVLVLPASEIDAFKAAIGDELAVWGGAARIYLPNAGPAGLRPDRHRYLRHEQLEGDPKRAVQLISSILSATITARRPPEIYERVRRELRLGRSESDAELLEYAEEEIARLTADLDEANGRLEQMGEELLDTQVDLEEAVEDSTRLRNQLKVMLSDLGSRIPSGQVGEPGVDLARDVSSMSEAVKLARELLDGVVIPAGVERDLDDLDSHLNARAWAELTWRGLRALHLYAEADYDGNFKEWCLRSGDPWAWPANDKKLAMRESESVETGKRLREQRRLPVDERVDPTGRVHMWAHLKISEGGGEMAPRVYFHDDTRGPTGKVHVGFIGPHRYMENTKTN